MAFIGRPTGTQTMGQQSTWRWNAKWKFPGRQCLFQRLPTTSPPIQPSEYPSGYPSIHQCLPAFPPACLRACPPACLASLPMCPCTSVTLHQWGSPLPVFVLLHIVNEHLIELLWMEDGPVARPPSTHVHSRHKYALTPRRQRSPLFSYRYTWRTKSEYRSDVCI